MQTLARLDGGAEPRGHDERLSLVVALPLIAGLSTGLWLGIVTLARALLF